MTISYAYSAKSRPARAFIRLIGKQHRPSGVMKRAIGYEDDIRTAWGLLT